jgi:hypothetical protein
MSRAPITKEDAKVLIPRAAILEAVTRCESVCNPALIDKRRFSVHVRKLPASEGRGWVVRVIDTRGKISGCVSWSEAGVHRNRLPS